MVKTFLPVLAAISCVLVRIGGARPVGIPELLASSLSRQPVVPAPDEIDTVAISQADKVFQAIDPVQIMRRLCDIPSLCLALPATGVLPPTPVSLATAVSGHTNAVLLLPDPIAALVTAITNLTGALVPGSPSPSTVPPTSPPVVQVAALPSDALSTDVPSDVPVFPLPQGGGIPQQTSSAAAPPPVAEVFPSMPRNLPLPAAASVVSPPSGALLRDNFLGLFSFASVADGPSTSTDSSGPSGPEAGQPVHLNLRI